jgi:hypothetical protein
VCTLAIGGHEYITQRWYECRTCNLVGKLGCCEACAKTCHRGHHVIDKGVCNSCLCDCGSGECGHCMCQNSAPDWTKTCTLVRSGKCLCEQTSYVCIDCDTVVCAACAKRCHRGHTKQPGPSPCFCQCADLGTCRCCPKRALRPHCTYVETRGTECHQSMWRCQTCRELSQNFICEYCAQTCHQGHMLERLGCVEGSCQCGVNCTITKANPEHN